MHLQMHVVSKVTAEITAHADVSQNPMWCTAKCQCVSTCPCGAREKHREWTKKMSVCAWLVRFPHGVKEKRM